MVKGTDDGRAAGRARRFKADVFFFVCASLVAIADQAIKFLVLSLPSGFSRAIIPGVLWFTSVTNFGASFGILQGKTLFLAGFSIAVIAAVIVLRSRVPQEILPLVALVLGGALGNLIDRVRLGFVVDYISVSFWPAFNLADIAITLGCAGIIIYLWKKK